MNEINYKELANRLKALAVSDDLNDALNDTIKESKDDT